MHFRSYTREERSNVELIAFLKKENLRRVRLNNIALIISTSYLAFTFLNKLYVHGKMDERIQEDNLVCLHRDARPCPLQNILWTTNVETPEAFYIYY